MKLLIKTHLNDSIRFRSINSSLLLHLFHSVSDDRCILNSLVSFRSYKIAKLFPGSARSATTYCDRILYISPSVFSPVDVLPQNNVNGFVLFFLWYSSAFRLIVVSGKFSKIFFKYIFWINKNIIRNFMQIRNTKAKR